MNFNPPALDFWHSLAWNIKFDELGFFQVWSGFLQAIKIQLKLWKKSSSANSKFQTKKIITNRWGYEALIGSTMHYRNWRFHKDFDFIVRLSKEEKFCRLPNSILWRFTTWNIQTSNIWYENMEHIFFALGLLQLYIFFSFEVFRI